jgi:predicted Zn-dependent protease
LVFSELNGDGNLDGAQRQVANLPAHLRLTTNNRGTIASLIGHQTYLRVLKRDFATAQQELEKYGANDRDILKSAARAGICLLAGDGIGAKAAAEEARPLLEARLRERPDDALTMSQLSWTYLALGQKAEALDAARAAADSLPIELDALAGPVLQAALAEIQARAGEPDAAVKTLRRLLAIPAGVPVSLNRLRIDPVWDPVRNDPEFQQLQAAGKEQIGPVK